MPQRYVAPDWFTRNVFNRVVAALTRLGISVWGSRVLEVRGRKTGEPRRTPVNLLTIEGTRYLVAPRGHTQWVRNLRVAGEGVLLLGQRRERFIGSEIADSEKEPILRAYLKRWKWDGSGRSGSSSAVWMRSRPARIFAGSRRTTRSSASKRRRASVSARRRVRHSPTRKR
jgi:deazaflavin-dependent oxidoreductase (nitroreductase family)